MTTIDINIITYPPRMHLAEQLLKRITTDEIKVTIWNDISAKGCWWNAKRAWLASWYSSAPYYMVMTEDTLVCKDFSSTLLNLLKNNPPAFTPYNRFTGTRKINDTWRICEWPINGLANICQIDIARRWVTWADKIFIDSFWSDDARYYSYLSEMKIPNRLVIPGLCQHMWWLDSTETKKHGILKAQRFIGEETSGLSLNPDSGYNTILSKSSKWDYGKWMKSPEYFTLSG